MAHSIDHGTHGPESHTGKDREPKQHTKDVLMCRQDGVFDGQTDDLGFAQMGGVGALPKGQLLTRQCLVTRFKRIANLCEVVAELAKTQGGIKHQDAPKHRNNPTQTPPQEPVHEQHEE